MLYTLRQERQRFHLDLMGSVCLEQCIEEHGAAVFELAQEGNIMIT